MEKFILCKKCGCELEFTEMPVEFKHKWKSMHPDPKYGDPFFRLGGPKNNEQHHS